MAGKSLQIELLGHFRLIYEGELVTRVNSTRMQALLTYLIIHRKAPQSREYISYLFWPTTTEKQAKTNLRQLFHHLKCCLPGIESYLTTDHKTLQWREDDTSTVDVIEFEKLLFKIRKELNKKHPTELMDMMKTAIEWYNGDLLPGCYEDWLLQKRDLLSRDFLWVLEGLIEVLERTHDFSTAIMYAHKLLKQDNLSEWVYGQLMHLYSLHHDRSSALRVYHLCCTTLDMELGVKPGRELQKIYQQIIEDKS